MKTIENKLSSPLAINPIIFRSLRGLYTAQEILKLQDMCEMVDPKCGSYAIRQANNKLHDPLTLQRELGYAYSTFAAFIRKLRKHAIIAICLGANHKWYLLNPHLVNRGPVNNTTFAIFKDHDLSKGLSAIEINEVKSNKLV